MITYASGKITVEDVGEIGFIDIYNADTAGGWGVVTKSDDGRYFSINAHLAVKGNTTLKDTKKYLTFTKDNCIIETYSPAVFHLGDKDEDTGKTYNGCVLYVTDESISNYRFGNKRDGEVRLFDSKIYYNTFWAFFSTDSNIPTIKIDGCTIWKWKGWRMQGNESYVKNTTIQNGTKYAMTTKGVLKEISGLTVFDSDYGYYHFATYGSGEASNVKMINNTKDFYFYANKDNVTLRAIDFEVPHNWKISWTGSSNGDYIERIYTFDPILLDKDGSPLQNYTFEIKDKDDVVVYTGDTNSYGKLDTVPKIVYGTYTRTDGSTMTPRGVHTLTISDSLSKLYEVKMEFDRPLINNKIVLDGAANLITLESIVAEVQAVGAAIANLHDFDPNNNTVAHVALVDTTTTNTDMRGTDGANTVAPDNTAISDVYEKIDHIPENVWSYEK